MRTSSHKAEYNEEAAQYFRRAAEQGDAAGQYGLGILYARRRRRDRAIRPSHASGSSAPGTRTMGSRWLRCSQAFLGGRLGFKTDPADAAGLGWVRKAGALDSIPALSYLAQGYRTGAFGAADLKEAERLDARIRELSPDNRSSKNPEAGAAPRRCSVALLRTAARRPRAPPTSSKGGHALRARTARAATAPTARR